MDLSLDTSVQYVKGVGPKVANLLKKKQIKTVADLIQHYPKHYLDYRKARSINSLRLGEHVSLNVTVESVKSINISRSRKIWTVIVKDNTGAISCKYFRVPYKGYFERLTSGKQVVVEGSVSHYRNRMEFHHPDILEFTEDKKNHVVAIYPEIEGISQKKLQNIIENALLAVKEKLNEYLPTWVLNQNNLTRLNEAIFKIHKPDNHADSDFLSKNSVYHDRIKFEEFFWFQLPLLMVRSNIQEAKTKSFDPNHNALSNYIDKLSFKLTNAQMRVLKEIISDLSLEKPMHRLVQGDVGSGKTVVALLSAMQVMSHGYQVAIMAPTEILAEQHFKKAKNLFGNTFNIELLTGNMKKAIRDEKAQTIESGKGLLCIGTHALIQESVKFKKLGLVIVDEQHRFGVEQRSTLKSKGRHPHLLVMTATPIPRSLSMTLYGDLDASIIDEMPKGRLPITTRVTYQSKRSLVIDFIKKQLQKGRQAYIVYPLVEESEKMDLKDATTECDKLSKEFDDYKVELLHGKLKKDEKEFVFQRFVEHKIDLLVSTTIIEVGIDVPNANLIWIENAERFGLSQLHQLRGRVGRGKYPSYCILMLGHAISSEGRERMKVMEETTDGFKIADKDLEIRGPGDFLGTRQSGVLTLKMANMSSDLGILTKARACAKSLINKDPKLQTPEHSALKNKIVEKGYLSLTLSG